MDSPSSSSASSSAETTNTLSSFSASTAITDAPVTTDTSDSMAFRCDFHVQCSVKRKNIYENPVPKICIVGIVHNAGPFLALCSPESSTTVTTIIGCSNWESCVLYESEHLVEIILCNPVLFDGGNNDVEALKLTCELSPSAAAVTVEGEKREPSTSTVTSVDTFNEFFTAWFRVGAISSTELATVPSKSSSSSSLSSQLVFSSSSIGTKDGPVSSSASSTVSYLSENKQDLKRALKLQVLHDPDFLAVVDSLCELVLASGTSKIERNGESRSQYRRTLLTQMYESLASIPRQRQQQQNNPKGVIDTTAPTAHDLSAALKLEKVTPHTLSSSHNNTTTNGPSSPDSQSIHTQSTKITNKTSRTKNANKIISNMNSISGNTVTNNNNNNNNNTTFMTNPMNRSSNHHHHHQYNHQQHYPSMNNNHNNATPTPTVVNNNGKQNQRQGSIFVPSSASVSSNMNRNTHPYPYHTTPPSPYYTNGNNPNTNGSTTSLNSNTNSYYPTYPAPEVSTSTPATSTSPSNTSSAPTTTGYYVTDSTTGQVYFQPMNTAASTILSSPHVDTSSNPSTATSYVYDSNTGTYYPVNYSPVAPSSHHYSVLPSSSTSSNHVYSSVGYPSPSNATTNGSNNNSNGNSNIVYHMVPSTIANTSSQHRTTVPPSTWNTSPTAYVYAAPPVTTNPSA